MNQVHPNDSIENPTAGTQPLVLAVDDEPINLLVMAAALEAHGCETAYADSAASARIAVRKRRPSLVLLDVMMPGESGLELCRQWRRDAAMEGTPIVLVTALGAEAHRVAGLQAGADDFIEKPLNIDVLLARVASWLARGRAPRTDPVACDGESSMSRRLLAAAREIAPDGPAAGVACALARAVGLDAVAAELALDAGGLRAECLP